MPGPNGCSFDSQAKPLRTEFQFALHFLAGRNVDAHADKTRAAVNLDAGAVEVIGDSPSVLADEVGLGFAGAGAEDLLDLLGEHLPLIAGEKIQRMAPFHLLGVEAGHTFEVAVPSLKRPRFIIEIEHAGQAVDNRVGQVSLAA